MKTKISVFLISVFSIGLLSGCIGVNHGFKFLRSSILENIDGDLHREFEFSIGPASIFLASSIVHFVDTDEIDVEKMLHKISRVQVSIYENKSDEISIKRESGDKITELMKMEGWDQLVHVRDRDELSYVFARGNREFISQLFVVAVDDDQFVMTEIKGDLGGLIEVVLKDKGLNLSKEISMSRKANNF